MQHQWPHALCLRRTLGAGLAAMMLVAGCSKRKWRLLPGEWAAGIEKGGTEMIRFAKRTIAGSEPDDITFLNPGISRADVESRLGSPRETTRLETGEEKSEYTYSRGLLPAGPHPVLGTLLVNALSFGMFELGRDMFSCGDVFMLGAGRITYSSDTQHIIRVCKTSYSRDSYCYNSSLQADERSWMEGRIPPAEDDLPQCYQSPFSGAP